jgi:hypothetical protein
MTAKNQPAYEDAEGIVYDESGSVTISAPLLKMSGVMQPPNQEDTEQFDQQVDMGEFGDITFPVHPFGGESVYATLTGNGDYKGSLSSEEYEALPTYYRRVVSWNGLSSSIIEDENDALGFSQKVCRLLNQGWTVGRFAYSSTQTGATQIVFPFSKQQTEYATDDNPIWTTVVPEQVTTSPFPCCGADPTYRIIQSPAVACSVSVDDTKGDPASVDYYDAPRAIEYDRASPENTWAESFVGINNRD